MPDPPPNAAAADSALAVRGRCGKVPIAKDGEKGSRVAARPRRSVWVLTSWHLRSEDEAFTADAHISVTARKSVECILHICHSRKSVECIPAFMSKSSISYVYTMNL